MTPDELRAEIEAGAIDTVVLAFPDHYGRLMGKRLTGRFFLDTGLADGTHACDYLFTVDMEMEPVEGYDYANWDRGYGDFHMTPDLTTIRRCGWTNGAAIVMCNAHDDATHAPVPIAPRSILAEHVAAAEAAGFTAKGASELEFFIFRDSYRSAHERGTAIWNRPAGTSRTTTCSRVPASRTTSARRDGCSIAPGSMSRVRRAKRPSGSTS